MQIVRGADHAAYWGGSHAGTRPNALQSDNYEKFLQTLERPNHSIKLFRLRDNYSEKDIADLMFHNGAGICVLSHTNVAVDEIKKRLSGYADKLLGYPNYIGTIQSFIDRFVTLPYADCSRDSGSLQDIPDDGHGHRVCRMNSGSRGLFFVEAQIGRGVNEGFIDAVHMNIHRRGIPEDDRVDQRADPLIFCHTRDGSDVLHLCSMLSLIFLDRLLCFKQTGPGRDTDGFEGRRDSQAYRLI